MGIIDRFKSTSFCVYSRVAKRGGCWSSGRDARCAANILNPPRPAGPLCTLKRELLSRCLTSNAKWIAQSTETREPLVWGVKLVNWTQVALGPRWGKSNVYTVFMHLNQKRKKSYFSIKRREKKCWIKRKAREEQKNSFDIDFRRFCRLIPALEALRASKFLLRIFIRPVRRPEGKYMRVAGPVSEWTSAEMSSGCKPFSTLRTTWDLRTHWERLVSSREPLRGTTNLLVSFSAATGSDSADTTSLFDIFPSNYSEWKFRDRKSVFRFYFWAWQDDVSHDQRFTALQALQGR